MKDIPRFPNYAITRDGRVWSKKRTTTKGGWLKPGRHKFGYPQVGLCKNSKRYQCCIHHIVLETYVGPCPEGMECRHLNGDPTDNRLGNLCWGTRAENHYDAVKHGTHIGNRKFTEEQVWRVFNTYHDGTYNQQELADYFGVGWGTIHGIVTKRTWRYLWST